MSLRKMKRRMYKFPNFRVALWAMQKADATLLNKLLDNAQLVSPALRPWLSMI